MQPVSMYCQSIEVSLRTGPDIGDITSALERVIGESGITTGQLCANVVGSTGSITTIEYEPGVVRDLMSAVNRLAPPDLEYEHEKAWHDGNGHSHVRASLIGPSITVPIVNGRLTLGTWQQIIFMELDVRSRERNLILQIIGE